VLSELKNNIYTIIQRLRMDKHMKFIKCQTNHNENKQHLLINIKRKSYYIVIFVKHLFYLISRIQIILFNKNLT